MHRGSFLLALAFASTASAQQALHWVVRATDLKRSLAFYKSVLGMKVLGHDEHAAGCPITSNGPYGTRWSRTIIGYDAGNTTYTLHLTHSHGVTSYEAGEGLRRFMVEVRDMGGVVEKAKEQKFEVFFPHNNPPIIIGPDDYRYELKTFQHAQRQGDDSFQWVQHRKARAEQFVQVVVAAADPSALADWYVDFLGMRRFAQHAKLHIVGYADGAEREAVLLRIEIFEPGKGAQPRITNYDGRNVISLPEADLRALSTRIAAEAPELVLHPMRILHDRLVLVMRDIVGYEIGLVSSETVDSTVSVSLSAASATASDKTEL